MKKLNIRVIKQMIKEGRIRWTNQVIHIVWELNEIELWIITAYYPDNIKWKEDLKTRKENN